MLRFGMADLRRRSYTCEASKRLSSLSYAEMDERFAIDCMAAL